MANVNGPHGFRAVRNRFGGSMVEVKYFDKPANQGAVYPGDLVIALGDGTVGPLATPGTGLIVGAALGYAKASVLGSVAVALAESTVFEAQANGDLEATNISQNANAALGNGGDANLIRSSHQVDVSTANTTATLDLKILALYPTPDNAYGNYARVDVIVNRPALTAGVAGV